MPSTLTPSPVSPPAGSLVLRPDPRWLRNRGPVLLIFALLVAWRVPSAGAIVLMAVAVAGVLWAIFKTASITLDSEGFTYRSFGSRTVSHQWVDVDGFSVFEQRVFGLIPVSRFLGWNFTPAYKNYKRMAIPRGLARWVGMPEAMIKPLGFDSKELASLLNDRLQQTRVRTPATPVTALPAILVSRRARQIGTDWTKARSWLGGAPRLGSIPWPRAKADGRPLPFLAQIDLAELAAKAGSTPLPSSGSLAFFVGDHPVVYVPERAACTNFSEVPHDAPSVVEAGYGGAGVSIWPGDHNAPRSFPFWPIDFTVLEGAATDVRLPRREFNFSASEAFASLGDVPKPLWWHSAIHYADCLHAAATVGIPLRLRTLEVRAASTPDRTAAVLQFQQAAPGFQLFAEEAGVWTRNRDPWMTLQREEAERLTAIVERANSEFREFTRFYTPRSLDDLATVTLLALATAKDRGYAALPEPIRCLINEKYLLPAGPRHQIFGDPIDIQGTANEESERNILLLRLSYDDMMHWAFGDNGAYHFFLSPQDLARRNWPAAKMVFESH